MTEATLLWSIWQALLRPFVWAFTRLGYRRFVEWVTALALNVEEHTITQSVLALDRPADWVAVHGCSSLCCRVCIIDRHERHGPDLLHQLSTVTGASECPRGGTRRPQGNRRTAEAATGRGSNGFFDLLQAPVFRHRQASQTATPEGPGQTPSRRTTRPPQTRTCLILPRNGQRGSARLLPGPLPHLRTWPASHHHHRRAARGPADRDPRGASGDRRAL